jgi:hypothetical protein
MRSEQAAVDSSFSLKHYPRFKKIGDNDKNSMVFLTFLHEH